MEGFNKTEQLVNVENRTEKIKAAEKSVVSIFEKKLTTALDRIGDNPYFRDLEQTL